MSSPWGRWRWPLSAATDKESIATIKELEARHGNGWVREWLALRGLDLNGY